MPRYARTISGVFDGVKEFPSQPPDIAHKNVKWLPCPAVAPPSFDPLLEKITGPTYTVNANDVTEVWAKANLTAQEISDAKDVAIGTLNGNLYPALAKALLALENDNRIIKSKINDLITEQGSTTPKFTAGQAAQITMAQLKAGFKALL